MPKAKEKTLRHKLEKKNPRSTHYCYGARQFSAENDDHARILAENFDAQDEALEAKEAERAKGVHALG